MLENNYYINNPLDISGSILKYPFADAIRWLTIKRGKPFISGFEWCSGIGEMGFELLRNDLCEKFVFADICEEPVKVAREIAERDGLLGRSLFYVSDNFHDIPPDKFDLIIGNPPTYCNIQTRHPIGGSFRNDRRASDINWDVHRRFYSSVAEFLTDDGVVLIHEIEPFKTKIFIGSDIPYDLRPEIPIVDFNNMITDGGLSIQGCSILPVMDDNVRSFLLESKKA